MLIFCASVSAESKLRWRQNAMSVCARAPLRIMRYASAGDRFSCCPGSQMVAFIDLNSLLFSPSLSISTHPSYVRPFISRVASLLVVENIHTLFLCTFHIILFEAACALQPNLRPVSALCQIK